MCVWSGSTDIRVHLLMLQFLAKLEAMNLTKLGSEFLPQTNEALAVVRIYRAPSVALPSRLQCI